MPTTLDKPIIDDYKIADISLADWEEKKSTSLSTRCQD